MKTATKNAKNAAGVDPIFAPDGMVKTILAKAINATIEERELTQQAASVIANTPASQLSLIHTMTLAGFSTDRLATIAARLGNNFTMAVTRTPSFRKGKITIEK